MNKKPKAADNRYCSKCGVEYDATTHMHICDPAVLERIARENAKQGK